MDVWEGLGEGARLTHVRGVTGTRRRPELCGEGGQGSSKDAEILVPGLLRSADADEANILGEEGRESTSLPPGWVIRTGEEEVRRRSGSPGARQGESNFVVSLPERVNTIGAGEGRLLV